MPERRLSKMRHHAKGANPISNVLASVVGVLNRRYPGSVRVGTTPVQEDAVSKHNRRDPNLPNLIASELLNRKQTLAEKIEQTRKKLGIRDKLERRYGGVVRFEA